MSFACFDWSEYTYVFVHWHTCLLVFIVCKYRFHTWIVPRAMIWHGDAKGQMWFDCERCLKLTNSRECQYAPPFTGFKLDIPDRPDFHYCLCPACALLAKQLWQTKQPIPRTPPYRWGCCHVAAPAYRRQTKDSRPQEIDRWQEESSSSK